MTNVQITKSGFKIEGHTNYASAGYDIVCAAISTISQAIIKGIVQVVEIPDVTIKMDEEIGYLECVIPEPNTSNVCVQVLLKTLAITLLDIEKLYSNYMKVEVL